MIRHEAAPQMSLAKAFSSFLFCLAAYNLSKLPWYVGVMPIPAYGLESSMPFHPLIGYRGYKLWSHPVLFLTPHTIMGSSLLIMYGLALRDMQNLTLTFYALAVLFALHVIPERAGIPNRSKGLPLNQVCIIMVLTASSLAAAGLISLEMGMNIIIVPCLGAAILELIPVIKWAIKKVQNPDYMCESPDGYAPLERNMNGYSGCCPFAKAVDITTQGYSSSKKD